MIDEGETPRATRAPSFPWWLRGAVGALAIAVLTARAVRLPISDPDTFWHIRTGQWLTETWQFVGPEPWSLSSSNTWVLHEWLPELLMGCVAQFGGTAGISWLYAIGVAGVGLCVWVACRRRSFGLITGLTVGVTLLAMSGSLSPRPHLVTFALCVVFVDAWLRSAEDGRARWWLVPLAWLWACSHGMWFLGAVIGGTVLVGTLLDRRLSRGVAAPLLTVWVLTLAAGALTPAGPRLLLSPLAVNETTGFISEWEPASITDYPLMSFMLMAALVVVVLARNRRAASWVCILLLALAVGFALLYSRTVAVGAAIVAPLFAQSLQASIPVSRDALLPKERLLAVGVTTAGLIVGLLSPGEIGKVARGPESLSAHLDELPRGSVVCNQYDIGGWLLWRHPDLHPLIDGRAEVYSVEHFKDNGRFILGAPGWESFAVRNQCAAVLQPEDTPVLEDLEGIGWHRLGAADGFVLLGAP